MGGTGSASLEGLTLDPLVTWRHHAPPSLLYRSTLHRKAQAARACVTSGRCSARRHWQQAASNDARAGPALRRDKCCRANTRPDIAARDSRPQPSYRARTPGQAPRSGSGGRWASPDRTTPWLQQRMPGIRNLWRSRHHGEGSPSTGLAFACARHTGPLAGPGRSRFSVLLETCPDNPRN